MKIHTFDVGPRHPAFVVAEGGSNHGGSLDAAIALTDAAADAGANAMKWQFWLHPDEMYDRDQFPYEWDAADKYQLYQEWLPQLRDRAHERGMAFGLSSFGFASLDEADKWVDFHKVASIEAGWEEFVLAVAQKKKPMIVSTGMAANEGGPIRDHLRKLIHWTRGTGRVFLQCTVAYPCELGDVDLRAMRAASMMLDFGYSDHTTHPTIAPCAAVALGACVIEKHIGPGPGWAINNESPDAGHSLTPYGFKIMVEAIRLTEQALGSSEKRIRKSEEPYLKYRRGPRGLRGA